MSCGGVEVWGHMALQAALWCFSALAALKLYASKPTPFPSPQKKAIS